MKCEICRKDYSPDCDYKQGRCTHHKPMIEIPIWRQSIYLFFAPLIIGWWCIRNPKKVWEQAKKDWNIDDKRQQETYISGSDKGSKKSCCGCNSKSN